MCEMVMGEGGERAGRVKWDLGLLWLSCCQLEK